jgi:serine/threonine protein kinase
MSTTSRGLRPFSPQSFGRYTLLTQLATGGMGAVYLARISGAEGFQKLVVIKKILPQLAQEPAFVERFLDEARMVVQLQHGSIAQVLDMDSEGGEYYLAMEFVDGKDLRKIAARARELKRPIPPALALFTMVRVLDALAYAHRKRDEQGRELNLVHRDVSPQNVLISYEGEVKVIDFGLAKSAQTLGRTQPHMVLGKFFYMAPEIARHMPADRRSDLYAAGICLWELLAGKNPFDDIKPHDILRAAATPEIPPIRSLRPELPPALELTLQKALAVDPSERFSSAEEMRGRLTATMLELDPSAGPESLAALVRSFFAAEYESERRTLSSLSRRKAELPEPPAPSPPAPIERQATEIVAPPQPVPLSRQATELVPPGFLPFDPEPPMPADNRGDARLATLPRSPDKLADAEPLALPMARSAAARTDPPTAPAPVAKPAAPPPSEIRPRSASPLSLPACPPGHSAVAEVTRVTPVPPVVSALPLAPPSDPPLPRAAAAAPSSAPGRPTEGAAEPIAAKPKIPAAPEVPESTVYVSPEFLASVAQGPSPGARRAGGAPQTRRQPAMAGEPTAGTSRPRVARAERAEAGSRAGLGGFSAAGTAREPASALRRFLIGVALFLTAAAALGAYLLVGRATRRPEPDGALAPSSGAEARRPAATRDPERTPALAQENTAPEPAPPSEPPKDQDPPGAVDEPKPPAPGAPPADTAARDPEGKPLGQQELKQRRLKVLHDSIARDLKTLSEARTCEEIGYACASWDSVDRQYGARLANPSDKNLRELEKLLEQSRAALDEAMAGGARAPR